MVSQEQKLQDLEREIESLESEIARLVAIEDIQELRNVYYSRVNEGQLDTLAELFTDDASVDFGNELGRVTGRQAIAQKLATLKGAFVLEFPHNHVVEVHGDTADGHLFTEGRLIVRNESFVTAGKVADTYVRKDGRWLIKSAVGTTYYSIPLAEGWAAPDPVRPYSAP